MINFSEKCDELLKEAKVTNSEVRFEYLGGGMNIPWVRYDYENKYSMSLDMFSTTPKTQFIKEAMTYDEMQKLSKAKRRTMDKEMDTQSEQILKDISKVFDKVDKDILNIMKKHGWKAIQV